MNRLTEGNGQNQALESCSFEENFLTLALYFSLFSFYKDENLNNAIAVRGILPKGMFEFKKRILEDVVANITRSGKHYKPSFLEKDHLECGGRIKACWTQWEGRKRRGR